MKKYNRIAVILTQYGYSQQWLAEQIGISKNAISNICRNISQPKLETLYKIAEALEVEVHNLLIASTPPNNYSNTQYIPFSKAEAEQLNEILEYMSKNCSAMNNSLKYYSQNFPSIDGEAVFDHLIEILVNDEIVFRKNGSIKLTIRGYLLLKDFQNKKPETKYIAYEALYHKKNSTKAISE